MKNASNDPHRPDHQAAQHDSALQNCADKKSAEETPRKRGRKPIFDQKAQDLLLALLATGCTRRDAAEYIGCDTSTINKFARRNPEFLQRVRSALMQREISPLQNLIVASKKSWRAAAWLLERTMPQRYLRRDPDLITRAEYAEAINDIADAIAVCVPRGIQRKLYKRLDQIAGRLYVHPGLRRRRKIRPAHAARWSDSKPTVSNHDPLDDHSEERANRGEPTNQPTTDAHPNH